MLTVQQLQGSGSLLAKLYYHPATLNLEDDKSSQLKIVCFLCQGFQLREHEHALMVHEKSKVLFRNGSTGAGLGGFGKT